MKLSIKAFELLGPLLVEPIRFGDDRGYFVETWNCRAFSDAGINVDFVQDNHSLSILAGTLRGLHFQAPPYAQDKLVRCTRGAVYDVAVDIRVGSPTYGHGIGVTLSAQNGEQLFIPKGFLHGFVTLESETEVQYKCSDYYAPECDVTVHWDSVDIDWPLSGNPILSDKDAEARHFSDFQSPFIFSEFL